MQDTNEKQGNMKGKPDGKGYTRTTLAVTLKIVSKKHSPLDWLFCFVFVAIMDCVDVIANF